MKCKCTVHAICRACRRVIEIAIIARELEAPESEKYAARLKAIALEMERELAGSKL